MTDLQINGEINTTGKVEILNARFKIISGTVPIKYCLELSFKDPYYRRTQNAVNAPSNSYPYPLENGSFINGFNNSFKHQTSSQLPPYVIRIFKKNTPETNTEFLSDNSNVGLEFLWNSVDSFNTQTYFTNEKTLLSFKDFGVGLVPFFYMFNATPWSYNKLDIFNYTFDGVINVRFDANGGAEYFNNDIYKDVKLEQPYKQIIWNGKVVDNQLFYNKCSTFNPENGFTEPGGYLITILRNALDNNNGETGYSYNINRNERPGFSKSRTLLSGALTCIKPPDLLLTQSNSPRIFDISFNAKSYGSVNIINNKWTLSNAYSGFPNFNTPKFTYYPIDAIKPNGLFDLSGIYVTSIPPNKSDAFDNITLSVNKNIVQSIEESYEYFNIRGAFRYDFRLWNGSPTIFNPYSYNSNTYNTNYINYDLSANIELINGTLGNKFSFVEPDFNKEWIDTIVPLNENEIWIRDNNDYFITPYVFSNFITIPPSTSIPIPITTTIHKLNEHYYFKTAWTEIFPRLLKKNILKSEYTLRLYKHNKSKKSILYDYNSDNSNNLLPVTNYKFIDISNNGLHIDLSSTYFDANNITFISANKYSKDVAIYTDKSGNQLVDTDFKDVSSSNISFSGWTEDEVLGGWLAVLQRNFTKDGTNVINVVNQGYFFSHFPSAPTLTINRESTDKMPISLTTTPFNQYTYANHFWSKKDVDAVNSNIVISDLSYDLSFNSSPSITEIRSIYDNHEHHELLNRVVLDMGKDLSDNNLVYFYEQFDYDDGLLYNLTRIGGITGFENLYYEASSNIVDLYEKREALQTQLNTEIVNIEASNKFVFKTTWDERYFHFFTNKLLGSKYTLRLYKRIAGYKEINDNAYMGISGDTFVNDTTITDTSKLLQLTDISNDGPVANYKYISDIKTGLDVSDNWYQIPASSSTIPITDASSTIVANSRKMDIITDRAGNIYYRDVSSSLYYKNGVKSQSALLSAITLSGNEWTENDIMGGWLMVLQRNFSTTDLPSVINVTNQACFAKYIPKPTDTGNLRLTLSIVDGSYNLPKNFVTSPTNIYKHAVNNWGAKKIYVGDGTTVTQISSNMNYIPDPTMYDLAGNYSYTQGPSKIFNNVYIDFGVGTGRTKFKEKLTGSSIPYLQSHEIIDLCGIDQTIYDFSTNDVTIYESIQTNDPGDILTNMQCNYAFYDNSGRVYFDLLFDDPSKNILLDNANNTHTFGITHIDGTAFTYTPTAYDVNIFKKAKGNGTDARSQWDTSLSVIDTSFVYVDKLNRGRKITKSDLSTSPLNSSYKIAIDACSNYISYANSNKSDLIANTKYSDLSGSFETGGYLVAIRRNFLKTYNFADFGSMSRNVTIECFTLNTQYVCVPPTQSSINYSKNVFGSGLLTLDFSANANPANEYYSLTTPFYNSYDASGNVDIGMTFYARTEGDKDQPVYEVPLLGSSLTINAGDTTKTYKITKNIIINKYPNLGSVSMFIDLSYNWFSATPLLDSFPIGKIGGNFAGVTSATRDLTFYNPRKVAGDQLYPNQATSTINRIIIPANNSYVNSKKQNVTINSAEFSVKNGKRHLAINIQEDPTTIVDLCSNWGIHQYPYALRLYKKRKEGATANEQWFDISGYKGYGNFTFNNVANTVDSSNNEGIGLENNFIDAEGKKIMNLFIGADGLVFYNDYPADDVLLVPFSYDDAGAYMVVVQRHFTFKTYTNDVKPDLMISTKGRYLSFIPDGIYNPFQLDTSQNVVYTQRSTPNAYGMYYDQEIVTNVVSNANPYSAYKPGNQNIEDITYSWTFTLPNIVGGKTRPFTGTTGSSINLDQFVKTYGGLDKEVVLETVAKYNFGVANNQLYEHYPLLSDAIEGPNIAEYSSTSYSRSLCIQRESFPPPPWARFTIDCSENLTPERREELQMRRKAETLKHTSNLVQKERTKSEYLSFVMRGFNQRKQTYATQTAKYTNPNTKEFSIVGGRTIALPSACQQKVMSFPTYCSDVPGRVMNLTYDPSVPLVNYKTVRTYVNSTTESYEDKK